MFAPCAAAAIPTSLTEIGACFRCCLLGALHHSGLIPAPFWRAALLNESYDPWWLKHRQRTSLEELRRA